MPGISNILITGPMIKSEKISAEDQKEYWSGVSMLLFLVKRSRPVTANATRELSEANDGTSPVAFNELHDQVCFGHKEFLFQVRTNRDANKP